LDFLKLRTRGGQFFLFEVYQLVQTFLQTFYSILEVIKAFPFLTRFH